MLVALALAAAPPAFDPLRFFAGRTEGTGRLHIVMRHPRTVRVHGRGRVQGGELVLAQTVDEAGAPLRSREWRIRQIAPGRYAGTLSDAHGPVTGEASGDTLNLRYKAKGGVAIEQRLRLAPDGRSAANRLVARKLGIVVARLDETIRKAD